VTPEMQRKRRKLSWQSGGEELGLEVRVRDIQNIHSILTALFITSFQIYV
jgi:hypothetical protein